MNLTTCVKKDAQFHAAFPDKNHDYLRESWDMLNGQLCIKCHSVGGLQVKISDPKKDIRGPNLDLAAERLRHRNGRFCGCTARSGSRPIHQCRPRLRPRMPRRCDQPSRLAMMASKRDDLVARCFDELSQTFGTRRQGIDSCQLFPAEGDD